MNGSVNGSAGVDRPVPAWLRSLAASLSGPESGILSAYRRSVPQVGRASAVLMLFGDDGDGPDVLLEQKADTLRNHAGHPAFPGGATEPTDTSAVETALREAAEETGLDPASVRVLASLPPVSVPVSGYLVTPVLGWWTRPHPVLASDPGEVARVMRVPVAELTDPANRVSIRHPSGFVGPGFAVSDMLVWGFTAGLLAGLLDAAGLSRPWDSDRVVWVDGNGVPTGTSKDG